MIRRAEGRHPPEQECVKRSSDAPNNKTGHLPGLRERVKTLQGTTVARTIPAHPEVGEI